uniref:Uncharacterized protein n=1 Tax=Pavo cristatus TaxID=9049 RepID=A0A8C9FN39_PAVCR
FNQVIELGDIDLNCPSNCQIHNTQFFGTDRQIIRRGQAFNFYASFHNREWDDSVDQATFTVETGSHFQNLCRLSHLGTFALCLDQTSWSASYKTHQPKCINISVFPPSNACIGRYILNMQITSSGHTYQRCLGDFYVLFNPWCADDPVYLDNQAQREEYILNEHGILYEGVHKHITSRPWHIGQFEDGILDICLKILDMGASYHHGSDRDHCWRNDPVHVSMVVNHMVRTSGARPLNRYDHTCLDPTPLETGRGSACSGPTWVRSIREGDLDLDYDGHYMFSRLNSNYAGWLSQNNAKKTKVFCDTWPCGQQLITKSIGSEQFEDITGNYKYELGENIIYVAPKVMPPILFHGNYNRYKEELSSLKNPFLSDSGINMRLKMANCPMYGEDVQLHWLLENLRSEPKNLKFNLCAQIITYNGCPMDQFWKDSVTVALGPREGKKVDLRTVLLSCLLFWRLIASFEGYLGTLASNQQARTIVEFTPYRLGSHRLLANLGCHKFAYCKGCAKAEVCNNV